MRELRGVDLKRAQLVPSSVFASPDEVVETTSLSVPQKLAILRRWEFDARRVAGFRERPMVRRIQTALQALGSRRQDRPFGMLSSFDCVPEAASLAEAPDEASFEERNPILKL